MNESALIGRSAELSAITDLLQAAGEHGGAHIVVGDPGVGKTSLLAAASAEARRQKMTVLSARGVESERHLSFATLHDLLRPVLDLVPNLSPGHREALLGAFGMGASEAPPERFFVALAALELIAEAAADQPTLLIVDDLQWLDAASRDVVEFVARRLDSEPAILLIASRPEPAEAVAAAIDQAVTRSVLGGLDDRAARTLLELRAPDLSPDLTDRVLAEADGNPLALLELPVALRTAGLDPHAPRADVLPLTSRLERAFAVRLADLGTVTRLVMLLAAVNDSEHLAEVVRAGEAAVGHAVSAEDVSQAVDQGLLATDGTTFQFRHPLVRSAVWQSASDRARRSAHRALARALADDPDRRAWHLAAGASGPDEEVAALLDAAADRALERGAPSSAAGWLDKAAELSEDGGRQGHRLLRAAEISFELGRPDTVQHYLDRARALPLESAERGRLAWMEGVFDDGIPGDVDEVHRLIASANQARDEGEPELAANLLVGASIRCWWRELGQEVRDAVVTTADSLPQSDDDPRLLASWAVAGGLERHHHVIDRLARWDHGGADPAAVGFLSRAAFVTGEFELTLQLSRPAAHGLRGQGRLGLLAAVLVQSAFAAMYLGRWDVMETAVDEAFRLASETRQPVWAACAQLGQANMAALRGSTRSAQELLVDVERLAVLTGNESVMNGIQLSKGLAELGRENPGEAFGQLRRMMDENDFAHHPIQKLWAVDYLAEAALGGGQVAEAREIVARLEPVLEKTTGAAFVRAMRYAQAVLADDEDAEAAFERAFQLSAAASPWYRARLDLAYGAWLRRRRRVAESRTPLRSAHSVFETLGAAAWSARASRELRAAGAKDPHIVPAEKAALSPQETQIARLAAQGMSNRDIGQQLYLSHRTIASHLYRIFPKLGVTSRSQLRAVFPEES